MPSPDATAALRTSGSSSLVITACARVETTRSSTCASVETTDEWTSRAAKGCPVRLASSSTSMVGGESESAPVSRRAMEKCCDDHGSADERWRPCKSARRRPDDVTAHSGASSTTVDASWMACAESPKASRHSMP
eukprot:3977402-Prymnesium_polylepis.1